MKYKYIEDSFLYDGQQLRSLFAYKEYGLLGDSIVAWQGPCDIPFAHMVDGEDILAGAEIKGDKMLHFIIEKFPASLAEMVAIQRLLTSMAIDILRKLSPKSTLLREGDDIFFFEIDSVETNRKKISISIATVSPVSGLIHFGLNIVNTGTPVETISFTELKVDSKKFANELMTNFCKEMDQIKQATQKVHWVK